MLRTHATTIWNFRMLYINSITIGNYVIVRVYLSLSSRLRDLRVRAKRSLNREDSEQIYSK